MDDAELLLVLQAVGGDADAFGCLADRYGPVLLGLTYAITGDLEVARDLTQEALVKAYTSLRSLHRPDRFGSWLRQIAANLARSHLRREVRHPRVPLEPETAQPAEMQGTPVEALLFRQEVLHCLSTIPEGPREALVMHYLVGFSPAEAARLLGISRSAFDTRLTRGREALRRALSSAAGEALREAGRPAASYLQAISQRVRAALGRRRVDRLSAARELALLAARANLPRLCADLQSPDRSIRLKAVRRMGETGDRRAVHPLREALAAEEETHVQAEICRSLVRVGGVEAIEELRQLARHTADITLYNAASQAASTLEALAKETGAQGEIPVAIKDLREAGMEALFLDLLADGDPAVRTHAADGLGRVESVKAIPRLVERVKADEQGQVRRAAAEALGAILGRASSSAARISRERRAQAIAALCAALGDPEPGVQSEAAWALTQIPFWEGEPLAGQVLVRLWEVLERVLERPGPWWVTFPALFAALGDERDRVRLAEMILRDPLDHRFKRPLAAAVFHLSVPGRYDANPLIMEAIRRGLMPEKLLRALGRTQDTGAIPFLREWLTNSRPAPICTTQSLVPPILAGAADALAGYPEGPALLREALLDLLTGSAPDHAAILAAARALETVGDESDAALLEAIAHRMPARLQIPVRMTAKRIKIRIGGVRRWSGIAPAMKG